MVHGAAARVATAGRFRGRAEPVGEARGGASPEVHIRPASWYARSATESPCSPTDRRALFIIVNM